MRLRGISREFTYDSFIETFGKEPAIQIEESKEWIKGINMLACTMDIASTVVRSPGNKECRYIENGTVEIPRTHESTVPTDAENQLALKENAVEKMSKRLRKISLRKKDSKGSSVSDEITKGNGLRRSKSSSFIGKTTPSVNCFSPSFPISLNSKVERRSPLTTSPDSPMSKLNAEDYRGYLSTICNKKNTSSRYWCLLAHSCLYCYSSKSEHFATDVIALGGYRLATPHTKSSIPYVLTLERSGKRSYKFHADNAKSYKKWVGALNKCLSSKQTSTNLKRSTSSKNKPQRKLTPVYERSLSVGADVAKSKAELLEVVIEQRRRILREQEMIEKMTSITPDTQLEKFTFLSTNKTMASSVASLNQSEDHGYYSSLDGSNEILAERDECRQRSPSSRSQRSMSTISVASSGSLTSIPEEGTTPKDVSPKVLAEIEEFRAFSQMTLQRKNSKDV